jgi:hypothetical protein
MREMKDVRQLTAIVEREEDGYVASNAQNCILQFKVTASKKRGIIFQKRLSYSLRQLLKPD